MTASRERQRGVDTLSTIGEGVTLIDKYDTEQKSGMNADQTGLFLQQFTNSVSHALYKERCAFKGYNIANDNLLPNSRLGLFASSSTTNLSSNHYVNFLPSIDTLAYLKEQLFTSPKEAPTINTPHSSFRGDRMADIPVGHSKLSHSRLLSRSLNNLKDVSGDDLRLPKIMNIRDARGNLWEISEGGPSTRMSVRGLSRSSPEVRFQAIKHTGGRKLPSCKVELANDRPYFGDKSGKQSQYVMYREKIFPRKEKFDTKVTDGKISSSTGTAGTLATPKRLSSFTNIGPEDSLEPSCKIAPANGAVLLPCTSSSTLVYHDDFERKSLLKKLNTDTRARKITYSEYIQQLSEVKYCSCQKETLQDMSEADKRRKLSIRKTSDASAICSYDGKSESENRAIYTREGTSLFPPELEELYTRSNLTIMTMNDRSPLPKNFLEQEKESARSFYPDWGFQKDRETPTTPRPCSKRVKLRSRNRSRGRISSSTIGQEDDNVLHLSGVKFGNGNLKTFGKYSQNLLSVPSGSINLSAPPTSPQEFPIQDDNSHMEPSKIIGMDPLVE